MPVCLPLRQVAMVGYCLKDQVLLLWMLMIDHWCGRGRKPRLTSDTGCLHLCGPLFGWADLASWHSYAHTSALPI